MNYSNYSNCSLFNYLVYDLKVSLTRTKQNLARGKRIATKMEYMH